MPVTTAPPTPSRWLPVLVAALGPPERDPDLERWTWDDGDTGVFIDRLTHAWQSVAWSPQRSVTLRTVARPGDGDLLRMIMLAGLHESCGE